MNRSILVVEDNTITRKMLNVALTSGGFEVREAGTGATALIDALEHRPALVILDYLLPDTDGVSLLAELRTALKAPELPAILMTGMVSRLEEIGLKGGPRAQTLAKPVETGRLIDIVRAELQPRRTDGEGRRVLVVDDDPLNLKLSAVHLKNAGYAVETAPGGAEALDQARLAPPDAILSDILMPGMDGFALCSEVRHDAALATVPIVLVSSSYAESADRELAARMGASALVTRTGDMAQCLKALHDALHEPLPTASSADMRQLAALHGERLAAQLERQTARNELLARQLTIQATALSVVRGLSAILAEPREMARVVTDVLVQCLDATGLSTGVLYLVTGNGLPQAQARFGIPTSALSRVENCFGNAELIATTAEHNEPVAFSSDTPELPRGIDDFLARLGLPYALLVPFPVLGLGSGVLLLASDHHDLSESSWLAFARSVAGQFGQTISLADSVTRLAATEARQRALMDQASDAILAVDAAGTIREANRRAEQLTGWPRDAIVGRPYEELVRRSAQQAAAPAAASDHPIEWRDLVSADGTHRPVEVSSAVVRLDERGEAPITLAILRDLSERMASERAVREAQERMEYVLTASPSVKFTMYVKGDTFIPDWVSPNVERILGYTPEEALVPGWWFANLHPDDRAEVLPQLPELLASGTLTQEYRFRDRAGEWRWLNAQLRLAGVNKDGNAEVVGSWSDVGARKRAELRLLESEEQYRALFDSNPQALWVLDAASHAFLAVNQAAEAHYGFTRDEFLAMRVEQLVEPADQAAFLAEVFDAPPAPVGGDAAVGRASPVFRHTKKDGTEVVTELSSGRIRLGARDARIVQVTDVTEKRSLEAQLHQAQKMESVGRLAGGVAHDFNNILGVIMGYGELLHKRLAHDDVLSRYTEDILKASERAAALTRQLLAFSRRQVLLTRILDLNEVVRGMERMLQRLIGEDVHLETRFASDLPTIRADEGQLEQVIMNLAVNARDAMPKGGNLLLETSAVRLDGRYAAGHAGVAPGHYAMLAVSDTGTGMTGDVKGKIFEPFYTTKAPSKGTGLGLATVHGIVRQTGGHIFVYSEPGLGTTFKIYLPSAESMEESFETLSDPESPRGTETVLVVEDEPSLREFIGESLADQGYRVLLAEHADDAMRRAAEHPEPIHLLLTDLVMPGRGGSELAQELAALRPELRVLYMSGYTDDAAAVHEVLAGDRPLLEKPFTTAGLARKVRHVLDGPRSASGGGGLPSP